MWPRDKCPKAICAQGIDAALRHLAFLAKQLPVQPASSDAAASTAAAQAAASADAAAMSGSAKAARELACAMWTTFDATSLGLNFLRTIGKLGMQDLPLQMRDKLQASSSTSFTSHAHGCVCCVCVCLCVCM